MITYMKGEFVISKAGHDKGLIFVLAGEEKEYVYIVDGKTRKCEKPKRKNKKHVQTIHYVDSIIQNKIENKETINDSDIAGAIKRAIKKYKTVD